MLCVQFFFVYLFPFGCFSSLCFVCVCKKWLQSWSVLDGTGICMLWMGRSESIMANNSVLFCSKCLKYPCHWMCFRSGIFSFGWISMFTHYKILCLLTDFQVQISTESLIAMNEHLIKWRSQLNWAQLLFSWHWFNYIPLELVVNDFWIRYLCIRNRLQWTTNPIITRWKCALNSNISVQPAGIEFFCCCSINSTSLPSIHKGVNFFIFLWIWDDEKSSFLYLSRPG